MTIMQRLYANDTKIAAALILALLLAVPLAEAGKKPKPPPVPVCSAFGWCNMGVVSGVTWNYTPIIPMGGDQIRVYSNSNGSVDGNLYLRVGSWTGVGSAALVLDVDVARDTFIRTSGVARGESGTYYAVLYTGDGYPTQGGYSPSWATSPDGYVWTWHGPITLLGRNQSSAANLIVDESRTDAYRFMFWIDQGGALKLVHSADGATWQSDGLNVWPIPGEVPQFVTAARDQYGYHLIGADAFPATAHRHLFSCTGLPPWHVLETNAATNTSSGKGTNLSVDSAGGLLHAVTSGVHFTLPIRAYPC